MENTEEENGSWYVSEVFDAPQKLNINQWSPDDRPREKLMKHGAAALSKAELLAILIGSGSREESAVELMKRLMNACHDSLSELGKKTLEDLCSYRGIGEAKALTIIAATELARRRQTENVRERLKADSPQTVYDLMRPIMQDLPEEEAWIILLNNNLSIIGDPVCLSHGGLTETAVDVRIVCRHALLSNATAVVLCHNHPSGNTRPSRHDDELTKSVREALKVLRITLADHIIVCENGYYSYNENGKL